MNKIDSLSASLFESMLNSTHSAMQVVAGLTKQYKEETEAGAHEKRATKSWLAPGIYESGGFTWANTGLAVDSIQGYAVLHPEGEPRDLPSRVDALGEMHFTAARHVAPVPYELTDANTIVGVLTMTAAYAPPTSMVATIREDAEEYVSDNEGLQYFEQTGNFDHHILQHTPLTVAGVDMFKNMIQDIWLKDLQAAMDR